MTNNEAQVSYFPLENFGKHKSDFINNNFDLVLYSCANFINPRCKSFFSSGKEIISKYKIPIFFIGIGLQTTIEDENFNFLKSFKNELCEFIEAVSKCGGSFSLRGEKTAEVFKKLGFDNYWVTGCPSIFMLGKNFQINTYPLNENEFKPLINGTHCLKDKNINHVFKKYPQSVFICQDRFIRILEEREKYPIRYRDLSLRLRFGNTTTQLLKENRIKLFKDILVWMDFIKNSGFNFSFGTRIHGNIVATLCKAPAFIWARDMRVLEMAEYFNFPYTTKINRKIDLFEVYQSLDYSKFNQNFKEKFDNFQLFFDVHKIPCTVGQGINEFVK